MARFNKIYLGPVDLPKPQVREALGDVAIAPGSLLVLSSGKFVLAGATTVGKVWLAQDDYLRMKSPDQAWSDEDTVIGLEMLPDRLYAGLIANGVNITAVGTPLTPGAGGTLAIASTSDLIVGYSEEIFNNTTGAAALLKFRPAGLSYLSAA